jgi:lipopolysaccharide export system permease protein
MSMSTFTKYLSKQIYIYFLFVLLTFVVLFVFFDFLAEVKTIDTASYSTWLALAHVFLQAPQRFYEFSPIAILIAGVIVLSKLSVKSEFVILRTSGLSPAKLFRRLCLIALPIVVFIFLLGEFVSPFTEKMSTNLKTQALGVSTNKLESGIWLKNDQHNQKQFIRILKQRNNLLEGVYIYKLNTEFDLQEVIQAKYASIDDNHMWALKDVVVFKKIFDNIAPALNTGVASKPLNFHVQKYKTLNEFMHIDMQFFSSTLLQPEQLSISQLYTHIKHLKQNKQQIFNYEFAFAKKIIYPFSALLMLLLSLVFAYLHHRNTGIGIKIFSGVMLGLSFYLFYTLFSKLASLNNMSVWIIQLMPFIVYGFINLILYMRIHYKG